MTDAVIKKLGQHYHEWIRENPTAAKDFTDAIEDLLTDAGVTFDRVSSRVKTWASLKAKADKRMPTGERLYPQPVEDIHDVVGVRVTVFHSTEIPVALAALSKSFGVLRSVDKAAETRIAGDFGYGSHHLVLQVSEDSEDLQRYLGLRFEVQVRTVLQHAWAEFEHDIRYKRGEADLEPHIDRAFALAAGLIELADQQFDLIAAARDLDKLSPPDITGMPISAETLPGILAMLLGDRFPSSRSEHYRWLIEILTANGIDTVGDLAELVDDAHIAELDEALHYRFTPGQVRLIDDLLLLRFGDEHITRTEHTGYRPALRTRRLRARLRAMR